jgi:hypothetical protein
MPSTIETRRNDRLHRYDAGCLHDEQGVCTTNACLHDEQLRDQGHFEFFELAMAAQLPIVEGGLVNEFQIAKFAWDERHQQSPGTTMRAPSNRRVEVVFGGWRCRFSVLVQSSTAWSGAGECTVILVRLKVSMGRTAAAERVLGTVPPTRRQIAD